VKAIALFLIVLSIAPCAVACSCVVGGTAEDAFISSEVVFSGVVESIDDPGGDRIRAMAEEQRDAAWRSMSSQPWGPEHGRGVTLRIMQWWKGDAPPRSIQIWTGYGGGDCGYTFEKGQSYLVFARRSTQNNLLSASICSRTAPFLCATSDLEHLGPPIRVYESTDREHLIAREQPYTTYSRPCIQPAVLTSERALTMNNRCVYEVDAVIGRDGTFSKFHITRSPSQNFARLCPASLDAEVEQVAKKWQFRPAMLNGAPVEVRLSRVSVSEPMTKKEWDDFEAQQKQPQPVKK
jgi:hypothetical protein